MADEHAMDQHGNVFPLAYRRSSLPPPVGVPHRFGVGVLMLLVTMFSVLFAFLSTMNTPPWLFVIITVLFMGVMVGQIVLYGGREPRKASFIVGGILVPLEIVGLYLYLGMSGKHVHYVDEEFIALGAVVGFLFGAPLGYLAGALMAGPFFLIDCYKKSDRAPIEGSKNG